MGIGVMLDLDETLVISRAIEPLRRNRQWKECYAKFASTQLPDGTVEFLRKLQYLAVCGVVTTSPRAYAEKLVAFHKLNIPVLVAYHDVAQRKPHPQPLLMGAQKLGIPIERCVYIGDNESDVLATKRAGAMSLSVCWPGNDCCEPSFRSWSGVLKEIEMFNRGTNGLD